ncbi:MAG: chloride channel protein [Clostridia bacterium]|nr:chloride channel protein [Clostridia bacterium]
MKLIDFAKKLLLPLKLCALGALAGILGGLVGTAFSYLLSFVTDLRESTPWLILFLPLGGVLTVLVYRYFKMDAHRGVNEIIPQLKSGSKIRAVAAPLIFVSTAITHLFGGSAGKEGAALQIGGAGGAAVSDVLRLKGRCRTVFIMSGMCALFASVFGTPLTALFFVLEFKVSKRTLPWAALPCFIASMVAKKCASLSGVAEERINLDFAASFSPILILKILVLAIGIALAGAVMCFAFEKGKEWAKKAISNPLIRTLAFSLLIILLTAAVGDMRYNGSGMHMAISAVEGNSDWYDFLLKILFTSVTIAAGFKGGEIVPAFCVGATFGCFFGGVLGLDVGLAAALGLVGLFCCAANSFVGAVFLGIELFGFSVLPYVALICVPLWLLSSPKGLFENRLFTSPLLALRKKAVYKEEDI